MDGALGSCKTDVAAGQQLQQLEPVSKGKGPRAVSLQVCGTQGVAIRKCPSESAAAGLEAAAAAAAAADTH